MTSKQAATGFCYRLLSAALVLALAFTMASLPVKAFADQNDQKVSSLNPLAETQEFKFQVTVKAGETFYLPTASELNSNGLWWYFDNPYNWNINWGTGQSSGTYTNTSNSDGNPPSPNDVRSPGIPHTYANAGTYTITITPNGSHDAWLAAFGFHAAITLAKPLLQSNRDMVTSILSPFTPLMTRTAAQISNPAATQPINEWYATFLSCSYLTTTGPGFSQSWANVTTAGDRFASWMFGFCINSSFTMSGTFNLPQNLIAVGAEFADGLFQGCSGSNFTMNASFNLPQNITTVGDQFAGGMFDSCSGAKFNMNNVFNLPARITDAKHEFASTMFAFCSGGALVMNSVFNLPQDITKSESALAAYMFHGCSGASFNMNSVFNLPQKLSTAGDYFACGLFLNCSGSAFRVNNIFKFPRLTQSQLDEDYVFFEVFAGISSSVKQSRTAVSIINNPAVVTAANQSPTLYPSTAKNTFGAAFKDIAYIHPNWGGQGKPYNLIKTFPGISRHDTAAQIGLEAYPSGAVGVIIATGSNFPDALAASALSGKLDYPILTVEKTVLPIYTKTALEKLAPTNIIILGDTNAVSAGIETALRQHATNITRVQGTNRIKTAVAIFEYGSAQAASAPWSKTAIIAAAGNYPDALAISSYAAYAKSPIFLAEGKALDSKIKDALVKGGFTNVIIVGDSKAISANIESEVKTLVPENNAVIRKGGINRYQTAKLIAEYSVTTLGMHYHGSGIATGDNFPDAITGGPFLGKQGSVLLLASNTNHGSLDLLSNTTVASKLHVFGDNKAVSQNTINKATGNLTWEPGSIVVI